MGFRRASGPAGIRNHLLVMSITGLTGPAARRIARSLPGSRLVTMPYGSGLMGQDQQVHLRSLVGFGRHPNVGAVLLIGSDPPKLAAVARDIRTTGKPVEVIGLDDCGHDILTLSDRGLRAGARLHREISRQRRESVGMDQLFLGLECGRSDPSSGMVSNPLIGCMADAIVQTGGKAVFGETTEWLGAEHLLAPRAANPEVREALLRAVLRREQMAMDLGIDLLGDNPGPTNIAAGLSTIEEKSLGAIAKSGRSPVASVLGHAQAPTVPGLHAMDGPAYSPESVSGFVAAGAQLILFSTGVGNSYVSTLAPTLKISANPQAASVLNEQLDFDASPVFLGRQTLDEAAGALMETLLDIASGTLTWGEVLDEGEEVVSRFGEAL